MLFKAAEAAEEAEMHLPASNTWTASSFSSYFQQQIAVALIKSSFEMRVLVSGVYRRPSAQAQGNSGQGMRR